MADDGEARMPKGEKSQGLTRVPANQQVRGSYGQSQWQGDRVSPATSESHQVELPTLHSTRMLNIFFKSDFRALGMHVHCIFRIRGQDRLISYNLGEKT